MEPHTDPSWWTKDHDSAWGRVKEAFRRDWKQTKHDLKGQEPDLKQDVPDTVGQALGSRPIPPPGQPNTDAEERAHRFGYGAHQHYGARYTAWNDDLEDELKHDWDGGWDESRESIHRGWDYEQH